MKKVIIMKGLPGSGKSTYSKKLIEENPGAYKRINRDDLRKMFDNGHTTQGNEKFIKKVRDMLIIKALEEGKHVIVDDTNLSQSNMLRIAQLVEEFNKKHGDQVIIELVEMQTSLTECIERDSQREDKVGEKVIRQMYRQFFAGEQRYAAQDESLPKAIICDLDGTLALLNRNPFDASTCEQDALNVPVYELASRYQKEGHLLILVSGREEKYKEQTLRWLEKQGIVFHALWMRPSGDSRKDSIVKKEIFEQHIQGKYCISFVLDDRNQVVDMWRDELKLPCFQVYYGDF